MTIGWQKVAHTEITGVQGIYEQSSTQKFPLGYLLELEDGRKFRYCKAGGANLAAGKMCGSPLVATQRDDDLHAGVIAPIGTTEITFTEAGIEAITVDMFKDGFLCILNDAGEGVQYKIKSNTAALSTADFVVTLYDPITVATAATSDAIITKNLWTGIILCPDDVIFPVGVPQLLVTTLYYYWSQTGGQAMVLQGSSTGIATDERTLRPDVAAGVDGAVDSTAGVTTLGAEIVGRHIFDSTDVVDTEYWPVWLAID